MNKRTKPVEKVDGVLIGSWRGITVYRCSQCAFDTLERQKFIDHYAAMHPPLEVIDGFEPAVVKSPDVIGQED